MLMAHTTSKIVPPERYPSGDIKPQDEPKERAFAPTLVKRIVEHGRKLGIDKRLGSQLGILHMQGVLTETEFEAGLRYADTVAAYEQSKGHPPRHSRSQGFEFGRKGNSSMDLEALRRMDPEAAEKIEDKIKRRRRKLEKAYKRTQDAIPHGHEVLNRVCCDDLHVAAQHHEGLKALLRVLAVKCYRLNIAAAEPSKRGRRKADAAVLAQAAVDTLGQWFTSRKGTVTSFMVHGRSITANGHTDVGEVIGHTIEVGRNDAMAEAITAQLLKAAEAKMWKEAERIKRVEEAKTEETAAS